MRSPRPHPGTLVCRRVVPAVLHRMLGGQGSQNRPGRAAAEVSSVWATAAGPGMSSGRRHCSPVAGFQGELGLWKA